jgi:hypothetical protein
LLKTRRIRIDYLDHSQHWYVVNQGSKNLSRVPVAVPQMASNSSRPCFRLPFPSLNEAITQWTLAASSDCTIHFTGNTLTIMPATPTIVADPETMVFGSPDPALAYSSSGFQFSDTAATVLAGSLERAAGETVPPSPLTT